MPDFDALAEDLMAHVPMPPRGDRWNAPFGTLSTQPGQVPHFATVSAVRLAGHDIDAAVAQAKEWFAARGKERFIWMLGPRATPHDVAAQLTARGAVDFEPGTALVLDHEPPPGPADVEIRPVSTLADFATWREVGMRSFGELSPEDLEQLRAGHETGWAELPSSRRLYLAVVDGEPVAAGGLILMEEGFGALSGGGTLPAARGRGCYRALVRARWDVARAAGCEALLVQASPMSGPILESVGFRAVAPLTDLIQDV